MISGAPFRSDVLSFGSVFSVGSGWTSITVDYIRTLPVKTLAWIVWLSSFRGSFEANSLGGIVGEILIVGAGRCGQSSVVLLAFLTISANIPNTCGALCLQSLHPIMMKFPRIFFLIIFADICLVIAIVGKYHFSELLSNLSTILAYTPPSTPPSSCGRSSTYGTYPEYCDSAREASNIYEILENHGQGGQLLDYIKEHWVSNTGDNESLVSHEWDKHGTCMSTLDTECYGKKYKSQEGIVDYVERTVALHKQLPTYDWLAAGGVVPSETARYTLAQLQAVAKKQHGHEIVWGCTNSGALDEAWYVYDIKGGVASGKFVPTAPVNAKSSCPDTGISYLPKTGGADNGGSGGGSNGGSDSGESDLGTVAAKTFLNVEREGNQEGCLISKGTWYTTGTCATYYLYPVDEAVTAIAEGVEFRMTSSKGPCSLDTNSQLVCASGNTASTFSMDANNALTSDGSSAWYAASVTSGSTQVNVATVENTIALTIKVASPK
ncbi:hypothetical protein JCM11251_005675 [Rhodosporidiobolus azoricus]